MFTLTGKYRVVEVKKKTRAEFFKDLKAGDEFELHYTLNGYYESAPEIKIVQDRVIKHTNKANQLNNNLANFVIEEVFTRDEQLQFIVDSINDIEGVMMEKSEFEHLTDAELKAEVEWYEYLLTK